MQIARFSSLQTSGRGALLLLAAGAMLLACSAADDAPALSERPQTISNLPVKENPPSFSSAAPSAPGSANALPIGHPGPPYPVGTEVCDAPPYKKPADYVGVWPPPASQWWGLKLSPLEQIIADTSPSQPWSRYVPDQACSKDDECGDGFCDRGRCNAIWTCRVRAGMPCKEHSHCEGSVAGVCIDGRCRSCTSDAECEAAHPGKGYICNIFPRPPYPRPCGPLGPHSRKSDIKNP